MIQVVLLGAGNVATHLADAFSKAKNIELVQIYGRAKKSLSHVDNQFDTTCSLDHLKEADIYIIAISDDEIAKFSSKLRIRNSLVVHTSGSIAMDQLHGKFRKGVLYPLQTFTKNKKLDFATIPICIEAEEQNDLLLLEKLASSISDNIYFINSEQRKSLHLAAVFVNNFTNHLYQIGNELCDGNKVPFEILKPLIVETAKKIETISPIEAQTGPAKRDDNKTIKTHISMLSEEHQKIYKLLTQSIKNTYGKKL